MLYQERVAGILPVFFSFNTALLFKQKLNANEKHGKSKTPKHIGKLVP